MSADNHSHIEDQIIQFILGGLPENEKDDVSALLENDATAKKIYHEYLKIYSNAKNENLTQRFNVDNAIESFRTVAAQESPATAKQNSLFFWVAGIAASVALAIGIFLFTPKKTTTEYLVFTAQDSTDQVALADGSTVTLNRRSAISYTMQTKDSRIVQIDSGEVFFSVSKDSLRPFIVKANNISVTVLGTSFNINAAHYDSTVVSVLEGVVSVVTQTGQKEILRANQEAVFHREEKPATVNSDSHLNSLYWKTRVLTFENANFGEFIPQIEEAYSVSIAYDSVETHNFMLTSKFNNQPIEAVLQILSATYNLPFETVDDQSYIFGKKSTRTE